MIFEPLNKPDILPIIEEITPVHNNKALCPFHDDRNPSLVVNRNNNTFRCFACGAHGDAIDFVRLYHSLSFKDALAYLSISQSKKIKKYNKADLIRELKELELEIHYRKFMKEYSSMLACFMRFTNNLLLDKGVEIDFSDLCEEEYVKVLPEALKKAQTASEAGIIKTAIERQREYAWKLRIIHSGTRQEKIDLYTACMKEGAANE